MVVTKQLISSHLQEKGSVGSRSEGAGDGRAAGTDVHRVAATVGKWRWADAGAQFTFLLLLSLELRDIEWLHPLSVT